MYRKISFRN